MSDFDVTKQPTAGGPVNKPASGTYGEGAALESLKAQLPVTDPAEPATQPTPGGMPTPPQPVGGGGLPPAMFAPTRRPDVPVSSPLQTPPPNPVAAAQTSRQRNLVVLDALVNDPNVSETTREWAQNLIGHLIKGSAR